MNISGKGLDFIERWEVLRLVAYKPTQNDVWTIGFGHTEGVQQGDTCTPEQASAWIQDDTANAVRAVNLYTSPINRTQAQFDALVSLVYNIGVTAFHRSHALLWLHQDDIPRFLDEAFGPVHGFVRQDGQILHGLVARRAAEQNLFQNGIYGLGLDMA